MEQNSNFCYSQPARSSHASTSAMRTVPPSDLRRRPPHRLRLIAALRRLTV